MTLAELLKPRTDEHWGNVCSFKPALVTKHFGDGGRFVKLYPINERPHYWVVRVDSHWCDLHENTLDAIYEAIDEQFGTPEEDDWAGDNRPYFPMYDGQGTCWAFV